MNNKNNNTVWVEKEHITSKIIEEEKGSKIKIYNHSREQEMTKTPQNSIKWDEGK